MAEQPTVRCYMTEGPHCIGKDQGLALASVRMAELSVRHLPVLDGGVVVGMLSEHDLAVLGAVANLEELTIEDVMSAVPYCVHPDQILADVAGHMAVRKIGSAVVMEGAKLLGVLTTTDALRALVDLLHGQERADLDAEPPNQP